MSTALPMLGIDGDDKMQMTIEPAIHHSIAKIKFDKSVVDQLNEEIDRVSIPNADSHQSKLVGQYRQDEKWLDIVSRQERIPLKNGKDTTSVLRETHHGPIISDIHPLLKDKQYAVSMAWVGNQQTNEISALSKFSVVKNWKDFSKVAEEFSVPGQNIVYADP